LNPFAVNSRRKFEPELHNCPVAGKETELPAMARWSAYEADLLEGYATAAPSSWSLMRLDGWFHGTVEPRRELHSTVSGRWVRVQSSCANQHLAAQSLHEVRTVAGPLFRSM
jgi:hypothetical protein